MTEATRKILEAYEALRLDKIIESSPRDCELVFNEVERPSARSCTWEVRDDVLHAEVHDTNLESGVKMMISTFARTSLVDDPDITIRMGFLPSFLLLFYVLLLPLFLLYEYLSGMNEIAILIGIFAIAFTPFFLWWHMISSEKVETAFARRIAEALNMDEMEVYSEYEYFVSKNQGRTFVIMLLVLEFIFIVLTLLPLLLPYEV